MKNNVHTKEKGNMVSVHFDSLMEFMDYVNTDGISDLDMRQDAQYNMTTRKNEDRGDWYGNTNETAKDVMNHALLGDSELYTSLQSKINIIDKRIREVPLDYENQVLRVKRKKVRADFGDELDIHKVYQGQCDTAWTTTKRFEVDSKVHLINIVVDISGHCGIKVKDSLWRAAVAVKLTDQLIKAGKSVKLSVGAITQDTWRGKSGLLTSTIAIKNYNENLSLERVAAMSNVSFFRTALFATMSVPEYPLLGSKGRPVSITEKNMPLHLKEDIDAGHAKYVVIGRANSEESALYAMDNIYKQIEQFSKGE